MTAKPETALVRRILVVLRDRGGFWQNIHGSPFQRSGLPDIIGCCEGRFYAFEVKMPGREKTLTALQQRALDEIARAGGVARAISSIEEALACLDAQPGAVDGTPDHVVRG